MTLGDVTSVFSRYFIVGFFLPVYVALVVLWLAASSGFIPNELEAYKPAAQLAILGGVAIVGGLVLSGLSYHLTRFVEGYPLEKLNRLPILRVFYRVPVRLQKFHYDRLAHRRDDQSKPSRVRQNAWWRLDRFFPPDSSALLPTRVGNAIRAFERHSNVRWGLDGITVWPRIEGLLSDDDRLFLDGAATNFYVFINGATGAVIVGICLIVDEAMNAPEPHSHWWLYALPFAAAYVLYRAAIGAAATWGDAVRASIDLHRLDLYEKLGVRRPLSFSDERELGIAVSQLLLYGTHLPDNLWRQEVDADVNPQTVSTERGCLARMLKGLTRSREKDE